MNTTVPFAYLVDHPFRSCDTLLDTCEQGGVEWAEVECCGSSGTRGQ